MLGGGTAEQEEEEEEEEHHMKGASTSLKDTFFHQAPILVASMQRTSVHQKIIHFALSFSKAFKHFDRNVCVQIEPQFLNKTKTL